MVEEESILTAGTVHAQRPVTLLKAEMKNRSAYTSNECNIVCHLYSRERERERDEKTSHRLEDYIGKPLI